VLLVNLLAALNFANVFKIKKNVWIIKNVTTIEKNVFLHLWQMPQQPGAADLSLGDSASAKVQLQNKCAG